VNNQTRKRVAAMAQKAIVGEKVGMTQVWGDDQRVIPVTVLRVEPVRVVQVKTNDRDGYTALQVTYGHKSASKLSKPEQGHFASANVEAGRRLVELRLDSVDGFVVGQEIAADLLAPGEIVDVTAVSRGKGFAGGMKRYGFAGLEASHGVSASHRSLGSTGQRQDPGKTFKGKKMHGHMGAKQVTTQNLQVVDVNTELSIIAVKGAIPGHKGQTVYVTDAIKLGYFE
jgi:large subunit ribosomal protein L3